MAKMAMEATPEMDKDSSSRKGGGFEEYEVRNAADLIKSAMELKTKPKLVKAALALLKKQKTHTESAITWADNLC
jgi:hypothetical protein